MKRKLSQDQAGFSLIELGIVIVVLVVLGVIVFSNFSAVVSKQHNQTRQNDLKALQLQIETYYSKYGYYPNLNDLNSPSWREQNMKNLVASDLVDPLSKCNPDKSACLGGLDVSVPHQYEYYATQSDGKTTCNGSLKGGSDADKDCAKYKLIATYEGNVNGSKTGILQNRD
jgi:type II secretory pathway pseudopilin PulG